MLETVCVSIDRFHRIGSGIRQYPRVGDREKRTFSDLGRNGDVIFFEPGADCCGGIKMCQVDLERVQMRWLVARIRRKDAAQVESACAEQFPTQTGRKPVQVLVSVGSECPIIDAGLARPIARPLLRVANLAARATTCAEPRTRASCAQRSSWRKAPNRRSMSAATIAPIVEMRKSRLDSPPWPA